jgi:hypothetical protein
MGVAIKRCDECEYRSDIRDNILVTAGCRAGYMDDNRDIELSPGVAGDDELATFVSTVVDKYINEKIDESFDLYIEEKLIERFKRKE